MKEQKRDKYSRDVLSQLSPSFDALILKMSREMWLYTYPPLPISYRKNSPFYGESFRLFEPWKKLQEAFLNEREILEFEVEYGLVLDRYEIRYARGRRTFQREKNVHRSREERNFHCFHVTLDVTFFLSMIGFRREKLSPFFLLLLFFFTKIQINKKHWRAAQRIAKRKAIEGTKTRVRKIPRFVLFQYS